MNSESVFARIVFLPVRLLAWVILSPYFGVMRLITRRSDPKLRPTRRARREIHEVAHRHCPNAKVFKFDDCDINPERLWFIAIKTRTDEERERLVFDSDLHQQLRDALLKVGYPISAIRFVFFIFESQETVDRDYGGSWHAAMQ